MFPITNDDVIFGMLMVILAFIFYTAKSKNNFWQKFYTYVPSLLLCYFIPSVLTTSGIVDISDSSLYYVASRYLLPASLVLLTLSIDLKSTLQLGPKALIMFFVATFSIVVGGPLTIMFIGWVSPQTLEQLYAFHLSAEYKNELTLSSPSAKLCTAFAEKKRPISENASIEKISENRWRITEEKCVIEQRDGFLHVTSYGTKLKIAQKETLDFFENRKTLVSKLEENSIVINDYDIFHEKEGILHIVVGPYLLVGKDGGINVYRDIKAQDIARGMTTLIGSWIGGGANQTAMKETFRVDNEIFSAMTTVDILVANLWMALLLLGAANYKRLDEKLQADNTAIEAIRDQMQKFQAQNSRIPTLNDLMVVAGIAFGITSLSHFGADYFAPYIKNNVKWLAEINLGSEFFWTILLATTGGLLLSFSKVRKLEGVGASKVGSVFLYVLVATIGMKMDLFAIFRNPDLFFLGFVLIFFHIVLLLTTSYLIRAPFFFTAVGSQANIGGAASAPIVASAVDPALAPVGVLLAVLGYALGTYCAWLCGQLMIFAAG